MSSENANQSRRKVLKLIASSSIATGAVFGTAAASPDKIDSAKTTAPEDRIEADRIVEDISEFGTAADCKTEYKCVSEICKTTEDERAYSRQCCKQGGDYICEDWQATDQCCF
jgi:hypothetical protein